MLNSYSKYSVILLLLLASSAYAQAQTNAAPAAPPPHELVYIHDFVYGKGGTTELHAEIVYPKDLAGPVPGIIYIHGGGWVGGTHKGLWGVEPLARAGFFTASIEYRLSGVAKWPAQIEDCKLAVRWLRANAAQYHVDPNRIGVFGDSAGGHLVTCLGTMADQKQYDVGEYPGVSSAVQAVADFFGPTDFTHPDIYSAEATGLTQGLLGVSYDEDPQLWKNASPLYFIAAGDPRFSTRR